MDAVLKEGKGMPLNNQIDHKGMEIEEPVDILLKLCQYRGQLPHE